MHWKAGFWMVVFCCVACAGPLHAEGVMTYGVGLQSCGEYVKARDAGNANPAEVAFMNWVGGYFSGANKTSTHRNNALGTDGVEGAVYRLERYCRARPQELFVSAASMALYGASRGSPTHVLETVTYGVAGRACRSYLDARRQHDSIYIAELQEYTNWLAGYLSGVNASSLETTNILGDLPLAEAMRRLETHCAAHPLESFDVAVDALMPAHPAQLASQDSGAARN